MNIATILLVFVIAWWMIFFAALPVGVRAQHEVEDEDGEPITEGTAPSAPVNPNLKKKAMWTTVIAVVVTIGYYYLANSGLVNFREY